MSRTIEEKRKHVCTPHGITFCDTCYPLPQLENPVPQFGIVHTPESVDELLDRVTTPGFPPALAMYMAFNLSHKLVEEMLQKDT